MLARVVRAMRRQLLPGIVDIVPAFDSITIVCDPFATMELTDEMTLHEWIGAAVDQAQGFDDEIQTRQVEIPIRYGGDAGPDLREVADRLNATVGEVIEMHCGVEYRVLAVGFLPGFAYLGGLPEAMHLPRRSTPRARVPAGSLGIGGPYTGVYPFASPGGWHLIGRAGVSLFDPNVSDGSTLRVGDRVRFIPSLE